MVQASGWSPSHQGSSFLVLGGSIFAGGLAVGYLWGRVKNANASSSLRPSWSASSLASLASPASCTRD